MASLPFDEQQIDSKDDHLPDCSSVNHRSEDRRLEDHRSEDRRLEDCCSEDHGLEGGLMRIERGQIGRCCSFNSDDYAANCDLETVEVDQYSPLTPAQKVRHLLTKGVEDELLDLRTLSSHLLYVQLDVLCHFHGDVVGWKEFARWLKYEEKVEAGGRWSKPHVTTASLHALFELRRMMDDEGSCTLSLDVETKSSSLDDFVDVITESIGEDQRLTDEVKRNIRHALLQPHKHKHRHGNKTSETTDQKISSLRQNNKGARNNDGNRNHNSVSRESRKESFGGRRTSQQRRRSLVRKEGKELWTICTSYPKGVTPDNLVPYESNDRLMKKIPVGTEGASILIGNVDSIDKSILAFFRLRSPSVLADLTEVAVPIRFVVLILASPQTKSIAEFCEVGRALALLLSDKVFCEVAYEATCRKDLLDGIDEFMDELTVLPPSIWDPNIRLEPPDAVRTSDDVWCRLNDRDRRYPKFELTPRHDDASADESLSRTGKLFGGLVLDIRRKYCFYVSDFCDALHVQCLASIVFLYFACITPIVTFGGVMGQQTHGYMGTMEMLVSGAVCGVIFSLFAGQPLIIVGATGPLLVFETIIFKMCTAYDVDFMSMRFWIGAWVFIFLLLLVALDLSSLVRYITRFTEESFTVLISVIFIYEAFSQVRQIWFSHPVGVPIERMPDRCHCVPPLTSSDGRLQNNSFNDGNNSYFSNFTETINETYDNSNASDFNFDYSLTKWSAQLSEDCITYRGRVGVHAGCLDVTSCLAENWTLVGAGCRTIAVTHSVPDVFLLSCVLFFGTFVLAIFLREFRSTRYFPTLARCMVSDFAVFLTIVIWTTVDILFGLKTPKLVVPSQFNPTRSDRGWMVDPGLVVKSHWWLVLASALPGILATVLIFLDQQITAVIVNRKEHKLKKGHGYHLDLFILSFLIAFCSLFGLPWFVAATVRAITHVQSLICESEVQVPGDKPHMLGIREQRVTGICVHILIGLSTLFTKVLQYIPMPVLYGVFLYMGVTSLRGVQFVERIQILLMPVKYQPDYIYLRHVRTSHVHCFTALQLICSTLMWVIKSIPLVNIAFPLMLVILIGVRKMIDFLFTQRDLYWLDHLLPEESRRRKEDKAEKDGKLSTQVEKEEEEEKPGCVKDGMITEEENEMEDELNGKQEIN